MEEGSTNTINSQIAREDSISQANPKFKVGDRVRWFRVPTQDFGVVIECFYGSEGSVEAVGWHYLVQLDSQSPSFAHCKEDYGFEDDLESIGMGE